MKISPFGVATVFPVLGLYRKRKTVENLDWWMLK